MFLFLTVAAYRLHGHVKVHPNGGRYEGSDGSMDCPRAVLDVFPSILLHHEEYLRYVRAYDKTPYMCVLLRHAFESEEQLCAISSADPFTPRNPKIIIYDGEPRFEIFEPPNFDDFSKLVVQYAEHMTSDAVSYLPRFYFVFSSGKCRNKLFVLQSRQFPQADSHTRISHIRGNSRTEEGWISHDEWARLEMSIDLAATISLSLTGDKLAQYDATRSVLLNDLKNFIAGQFNGSMIDYDLRVSQSSWKVPLCDPTGKNGKKCVMPLEIKRHALWPIGFVGDDRKKTKRDFIDSDNKLFLETQHLTKEFQFLRRKLCHHVKDKLHRSAHDQNSNNCVASVRPKGRITSVEYDLSAGEIDDVVIWDVTTSVDARANTAFNFSSYFMNFKDLASVERLPDVGIYRVHAVKAGSLTYQRGVREKWSVLSIDGRRLRNAKFEVQGDINHRLDFDKIRSIPPVAQQRKTMTITYENPDVVQTPDALDVRLYCFSFDNVVFNRTKADSAEVPSYCHSRTCKYLQSCRKCYPRTSANYLTALIKAIAQAMPNHFDDLLLPVELKPSDDACVKWNQF